VSFASVCLLSFNRPRFLRECIASMRNAGAPFELIVHDDGSSDESLREGLGQLLDAGVISTLILNPPGWNQGQGVALNRMFSMARGDPIIKCDQDLIFEPGWLAQVNAILASAQLPSGVLLPLHVGDDVVDHTLVDEDDAAYLIEYRWRLSEHGYAVGSVEGREMYLHRLVVENELGEGLVVDHANGRKLDNRKENLRVFTQAGCQNQAARSRYRGVGWSANEQRWKAKLKVNGLTHNLGTFVDELDAAYAVEEFRREHLPHSRPDPALFPDPPAIGLLGLFKYEHDPVDWRKTQIAHHGSWEEHELICGSGFAIPRRAFEVLGPFEEHSEAFAEDHDMQLRVTGRGLWACGLPPDDLAVNQGFGVGPSTVVVSEGKVQSIHKQPVIHGGDP
jgi:GT2 family glycosyltransferase